NVDFGANSLLAIQFLVNPANPGTVINWSMHFSGLGAKGAITEVTEMVDTFPGLTIQFDANDISLIFPGRVQLESNFIAQFQITQASAVPEPSTLLLAILAAGMARRSLRRRTAIYCAAPPG